MAKDTFIVYKSYFDRFSRLTDEQMGKLFRAILEYECTGEDPVIDDAKAEASFEVVKYDLDLNDEKYEEICRKRRESGSLGGKQKVANASKCYQKVASVSKSKQNLPVYDSDNDNDNHTDSDNDLSSGLFKTIIPSDKGVKKKDTIVSQKENRISKEDLDEIIARWNTLPEPVPKLTVLKPGTKRYESLTARYDDYGVDNIMIAIEKVRKSSFLCGKSSNWHISFDWFVLPNNFPKVLDGNYTDTDAEQKPKSKGSMIDEWIERGLLQ